MRTWRVGWSFAAGRAAVYELRLEVASVVMSLPMKDPDMRVIAEQVELALDACPPTPPRGALSLTHPD